MSGKGPQSEPEYEASLRYRTCEVCGQRYDTTDLDQVFHHDGKPHEPLSSDQAS